MPQSEGSFVLQDLMQITDSASIAIRIARLKDLAEEYFQLPAGALIEYHDQLLRIFDIRGSMHKRSHPHKTKRVYISRRALKHFVERRKEELAKNHSLEEALGKILFAIERMRGTITDFDKYEFEPPGHAYSKDYSAEGYPSLRICVESKEERLEVVSIHFTKHRKRE
jgi:hypothetical protein